MIAPTFSASRRPSKVPVVSASMPLTLVLSTVSLTSPLVGETSVSGNIIFEIASAAGADITEAAIKCSAGIPKDTYAASTPPEIVEKPPVITACSSDIVIVET